MVMASEERAFEAAGELVRLAEAMPRFSCFKVSQPIPPPSLFSFSKLRPSDFLAGSLLSPLWMGLLLSSEILTNKLVLLISLLLTPVAGSPLIALRSCACRRFFHDACKDRRLLQSHVRRRR